MGNEEQKSTEETAVAENQAQTNAEVQTTETSAPGLNLESQGEKEHQDDAQGAGEEKEAEQKVPESYEDFKLPEGFEPLPELADAFGSKAKELGLTQDKAQALVDFFAEHQKQLSADTLARQDEFVDMLKEQCMKDPEIGGSKWRGDAEVSVKLALDKLGTPELRQVIKENPALAVHPEMVRFFKRAGDLLREGKAAAPRAGVETISAANVLFDKN